MKMLKPIMFVGTGSDVGKSIINTAICRILLQDGYQPAPFKAQNMSLNSYATPDGLEIGRAQAVQAEACGIQCEVEMNPVLLKPTANMHSQVILNGKPVGNQSAKEYFLTNNKAPLFREVLKAYNTLSKKYNPIVLEGAGSISELNLKERDITNMRMAIEANAVTYLVADIDRGGVFASVYGSLALLSEKERKLIKGIIINKFRGDIDLFSEGKKIIEDITDVPVVGIVPFFNNINIDEEDSVSLQKKKTLAIEGKVNIGIVTLKHMANFTDFNRFNEIDEVNLYFSDSASELTKADIIIIPGSKNTISDMEHLWLTGLANFIKQWSKKGKPVYGICGGYQIMGQKILDPLNMESDAKSIEGLGLLPVTTTITSEKNSTQCSFRFLDQKEVSLGYEIHMGESVEEDDVEPLAVLENGHKDGCYLNNNTWGTYIHGIFDNANILKAILQPFLKAEIEVENYFDFKEKEYNKLAGFVRSHIDMKAIYKELKSND